MTEKTQTDEAKKFLRRYRILDADIRAKQERLKRLRESAEYASPFNPSGVHSPQPGDKVGDAVVRIITLENEIREAISARTLEQKKIETAIASVPDEQQRIVLESHYIYFFSFAEIADIFNYSVRNVFYLHNKGLENIKIPENFA